MGYTPVQPGATSDAAAAAQDPYANITVVVPGSTTNQAIHSNDTVSSVKEWKTQNIPDFRDSFLKGLSSGDLLQLQQDLSSAGYINDGDVTGLLNANTVDGYTKLLVDVHDANSAGKMITPQQYLAQVVQAANDPNAAGTGGTHTSTSVNYTSPQDARSAAEQVFEAELGKRPDQKQLDAFYSALRVYEQTHPSTSTTTTHGQNSSTVSVGGGFNPADFAQQYVEDNYGAQVGGHDALHYFDLIANTLSGPPGAHAVA